jgi:hypothetical protein
MKSQLLSGSSGMQVWSTCIPTIPHTIQTRKQTLMNSSIQQIQLRAVRAYMDWVDKLYPDKIDGADRLILVLRIYEWQLRRYELNKPATVDQLGTLKHGIRTAEILINAIHENESEMMEGWLLGCKPKNQAQSLCSLLWQIVMALTQDVQETERLYPELKTEFDRERASYRKMKDAADEAEQDEEG